MSRDVSQEGTGSNRRALWVVLCVAGCLACALLPAVGCGVVTAALWLLRRERMVAWGVGASVVTAAVLCAVSWASLGSYAVPAVACALVCALALPGRVSVTSVCACIVGVGAAVAGADESVLAMAGSSLPAYVSSSLGELAASSGSVAVSGGSSVAVQASLERMVAAMGVLWPLVYLGQGALVTLAGLVGLALARRIPYRALYASFVRLHVPAWGVVALAAAVLCWACSQRWPDAPWAGALASAGLCALAFLRVVFFLQGLAVLMFLMERHAVGEAGRIALVALALVAEFAFFAVCVFGAIDTLANFRRIDWHAREVQAAGTRALGPGE